MKILLSIVSFIALFFLLIALARDVSRIFLPTGGLLIPFLIINIFNRTKIKAHQHLGFGNIYISKLEKILLFPGLPNGYEKSNITYQRILFFNTIVLLILMWTVFTSGNLVIFQVIAPYLHFLGHAIIWAILSK